MKRVQHHSLEVLSAIGVFVSIAIGIVIFSPIDERNIFLSIIGLLSVSATLFLLWNSIHIFLSKKAQHRKRILGIITIGLSIVVYIYYLRFFGLFGSIIFSLLTIGISSALGKLFHKKYPETSEKIAITAKE